MCKSAEEWQKIDTAELSRLADICRAKSDEYRRASEVHKVERNRVRAEELARFDGLATDAALAIDGVAPDRDEYTKWLEVVEYLCESYDATIRGSSESTVRDVVDAVGLLSKKHRATTLVLRALVDINSVVPSYSK